MKKRLRNKWIKALRSGDYAQTTGMLNDTYDKAYCCLGVLCIVAGEEFDKGGYIHYKLPSGEEDREGSALPKCLKTKWEITNVDEAKLVDMNDQEGCSFSAIADWIEENL